jgi:signal peptidase II
MSATWKLRIFVVMAASAALLVAIDQWTKVLAASQLAGKGMLPLVGNFAFLVFVRNSGAFLSLGAGLPPLLRTILLVALPIAALGFFAWTLLARAFDRRKAGAETAGRPKQGAAELAAAVLIIAGGAGNLIDRLLFGEVRDFLFFRFWSLSTGIMNLADLYILAAIIVMAVSLLVSRGPSKAMPKPTSPPSRP